MRGSTERADWARLGAVCVAAFILRLIVIANMRQVGVFADMQEYFDRAVHLAQTGTLVHDAFRVPGFPILIAGVFTLFGQSLLPVRVVQALLGTGTVALTYFMARQIVARRQAVAAAAVVAIYPALLLYSVYLMAETLFSFLVVLTVFFWLKRRAWAAGTAGVALGAATLTRSVGVALLAAIVVSEVWRLVRIRHVARTDRGGVRSAAISRPTLINGAALCIGFAVVLMPWAQRNYAIYQRLVLTDTSSGINVLLGNYPAATGRHPGLPAVEAVSRQYLSAGRTDLERHDLGMQAGRAFVRQHPLQAAKLAAFKAGYLLGVEGREHAWGYSYHVQGRRSAVTVWAWGIAIMASFPLVMGLATVGLIRPGATQSDAGLLTVAALVCAVVVHIASFGDSRFHLPWIPFLAIFAARAFDADPPLSAARRAVATVCVIALALMWASQLPELLNVLPRLAASPVPLQLPY
jgi:4-amino-4-deoxy-L-arabinose transferase-like glycosyltransferase